MATVAQHLPDQTRPTLTIGAARLLTDEVKADAAELWAKLLTLYEGEAHLALGYSSWGAYYEAEFGQSRGHGYMLLRTAEVREIAASVPGHTGPGSVKVARELAPLRSEPERLREAWSDAVERHGDQPTAEQVREVVRDLRPTPGQLDGEVTRRPVDHVAAALREKQGADVRFQYINEAARYLRGLPDPEELPLPADEGNRQVLDESIRFLVGWAPRMASAWEHRTLREVS